MNADPRIIPSIENGIEYASELLAIHDREKGRTTPTNWYIAETLEADIADMKNLVAELKATHER